MMFKQKLFNPVSAPATLLSRIGSIEIIPPADPARWTPLIEAILAFRMPEMTVAVVHQVPESTKTFAIALAKHMPAELIVPHLAVNTYDHTGVRALLNTYRAAKFKRIFVVRGDNPTFVDTKAQRIPKPLHTQTTLSVIEVIQMARMCDFWVTAACHPEGHPLAPAIKDQIQNALDKQEAGCEALVTQSIFHLSPLQAFAQQARAAGLKIPMQVNVLPICSIPFLQQFIAQNKLSFPDEWMHVSEREKQHYYCTLMCELSKLDYPIVLSSLNKTTFLRQLSQIQVTAIEGISCGVQSNKMNK